MAHTVITLPFDLTSPVRANWDGEKEGLRQDRDYRILQVQVNGDQEQIQYLVQAWKPSQVGYLTHWVNGAMIYQERIPEKPDASRCSVTEANTWLKHLVRSGKMEEALEWIKTTETTARTHAQSGIDLSTQPYTSRI